jgi:hypothetical protein
MKKRLPRFCALMVVATFVAGSVGAINVARAASTTATISIPSSLTASDVIAFSSDVWRVSTSNIVLRVQETTTNLAASVSCADSSGHAVDCSLGPVRSAHLRAASALTPGQRYQVVVNPSEGSPAPVSDYLSPLAITSGSKSFIASLFEQESSVAASYQWRVQASSSTYKGSYQADFLKNAAMSFGFTGSSVTWYTILGPAQGIAAVYIDGVGHIVNNYSPTARYKVARSFLGLASGAHRFGIKVLGVKGASGGTGTWVSIDSFAADGVFIQPAIRFAWQPVTSTKASGGRYVRAGTRGASVRFVFRGRSIDWITLTGPTEGTATMYVDGIQKASVNNHSSVTRYGVIRRLSNLSDAVHTLMIVSATGGATSIDRFVVRLPDLTIFRGLGTWVDLYDYSLDPATAVADMHARGVRTIYIETARYNSSSAFDFPAQIGQWVESAHAAGMKIVGWYLPTYGTYLNTDVSRTVAIATYRSPAGQGFDGLGIDIEHKTSAQARSAWFADIATHLARVRSGATAAFPIGAIVPAPLAMDLNPASWSGFPWASIGSYANVVLPMGYWSYRTDCSTDPSHCPYGYSVGNINESRTKTGGLLVHLIGGVADNVTARGVADFIRACKDANAYGCSLYDYRTTSSTFWSSLAGANAL